MTDQICLKIYRKRPSVAVIRAYLLSKGWIEFADYTEKQAAFSILEGKDKTIVLLPKKDDWPDIALRVNEVIVALAAHENRPQDELWVDIEMTQELLPCMCGGQAEEVETFSQDEGYITCPDCGISTPHGVLSKLRQKWSTRAPDPRLQDALRALDLCVIDLEAAIKIIEVWRPSSEDVRIYTDSRAKRIQEYRAILAKHGGGGE